MLKYKKVLFWTKCREYRPSRARESDLYSLQLLISFHCHFSYPLIHLHIVRGGTPHFVCNSLLLKQFQYGSVLFGSRHVQSRLLSLILPEWIQPQTHQRLKQRHIAACGPMQQASAPGVSRAKVGAKPLETYYSPCNPLSKRFASKPAHESDVRAYEPATHDPVEERRLAPVVARVDVRVVVRLLAQLQKPRKEIAPAILKAEGRKNMQHRVATLVTTAASAGSPP